MLCPNCGNETKPGAQFCMKCGTRLTEGGNLTDAPSQGAIPDIAPQDPAQQAAAQPGQQPYDVSQQAAAQPGQLPYDVSQQAAAQPGRQSYDVSQQAATQPGQQPYDVSQQAAAQPGQQPYVVPQPPTGAQPGQQPYIAPQPYQAQGAMGGEPPKKKKTGLLIAAIIGGIILVAGLTIGGIFLFGGSKSEDTNNPDNEQTANTTETTGEYADIIKKAEKLYTEGKKDDAIAQYEAAIDLSPKEAAAYVGLYELYMTEGDPKAAGIVADNGLDAIESPSGKMKLETSISKFGETGEGATAANDPATPDSEGSTTEPAEPTEAVPATKSEVVMSIRQIDNSNYPEIAVYADISDLTGNNIEDLKKDDLVAEEQDAKGQIHHVAIKDVVRIMGEENISINLVIDKSGSMSDYDSMQQVKNAVHTLIDHMDLAGGDQMEIVSFDDYVYLNQEFSSDQYRLRNAVDSLYPGGMTSLYDAIYSALYQTYSVTGAKCVVAFTDGLENNSSYSYSDVVSLARSTGIPVYIVGVGGEYDAGIYMSLADECGGMYYSASRSDIQSVLADIYIDLYEQQQDYWVLRYDTANKKNTDKEWKFMLSMSDTSPYTGECEKPFVAKADLAGAFSDKYFNVDYMIPYSGTQALTYSDLAGLSLAQLRIARNEIFARHGRQFKDALLNQWFYSKTWYLSIPLKYEPDYFDKYNPNPLSKVESDNVRLIKSYEESLVASQDIFPNANMVELSTYDLALTKEVLKKALEQMKSYPDTQTLRENMKRVQDAINTEGIKY